MNSAFVLRISPSGVDRVPEALETEEIIIGWSRASGLLDEDLEWEEFRQIVHDSYYATDSSFTRSGKAAGNLWRFIREMNSEDLIVVPYHNEFFIAKVTGSARYNDDEVHKDAAYRRPVEWLNRSKSIPRRHARAALQSRMKIRGTCARAADLVEEIKEALQAAKEGGAPSFEKDLRLKLVDETLNEMRSGRINPRGFERLVKTVLEPLGASRARLLSPREDKGVELPRSRGRVSFTPQPLLSL